MSIGGVDKLSYSDKKKRKHGKSEPIVLDGDKMLENVAKARERSANGKKGAEKRKNNPKVTPKQKRVAKLMIENAASEKPKNKAELLRQAGYSETYAASHTGRVMASPGVKKALAEYGFKVEQVNEVIERALNAKDSSWFKGERIESDAPDHKVQLAAISTLGDFTGLKKYQVEQKSINVNIDGSELADLLDL